MSDEIDQEMKIGQDTCFFLRLFSPAPFDQWKPGAPGDHVNNRTSVSDKIDQKTKVDQNTCFFSLIFLPQLR